jgi:hypothetical protein
MQQVDGVFTELFYLPNIEFFTLLEPNGKLFLDGHDLYQKQTYRNRTSILLSNKVANLSIPVLDGNKKKPFKEVKIDYDQKWKNVHLRGIQSAYGKAPFFEYFYPYIEEVIVKNPKYLFDLNFELLTLCLKLLQLNVKVSVWDKREQKPDAKDYRGAIIAKEDFSSREFYQVQAYTQLFGVNFVPNLSVIDLLFCEGPSAKSILRASKKND